MLSSGFDGPGSISPAVTKCPGAMARDSPDLVINAAAYTAVDHAESEPEAA